MLATAVLALVITMPFFNGAYDAPSSLKQAELAMASMALVEISSVHGAKAGFETNLPLSDIVVDWESLLSEQAENSIASHETRTFIPLSNHLVYTLTTSSNL